LRLLSLNTHDFHCHTETFQNECLNVSKVGKTFKQRTTALIINEPNMRQALCVLSEDLIHVILYAVLKEAQNSLPETLLLQSLY